LPHAWVFAAPDQTISSPRSPSPGSTSASPSAEQPRFSSGRPAPCVPGLSSPSKTAPGGTRLRAAVISHDRPSVRPVRAPTTRSTCRPCARAATATAGTAIRTILDPHFAALVRTRTLPKQWPGPVPAKHTFTNCGARISTSDNSC